MLGCFFVESISLRYSASAEWGADFSVHLHWSPVLVPTFCSTCLKYLQLHCHFSSMTNKSPDLRSEGAIFHLIQQIYSASATFPTLSQTPRVHQLKCTEFLLHLATLIQCLWSSVVRHLHLGFVYLPANAIF